MSMTFTKLFSSITASTIWAEPDHTRLVWITMLAMADQHGRVWASIPGLANMARVSIEKCEESLEALQSPDKYSRTKEFEGRRIEEIDGGWRLLNHGKYRAIRDEESIRESKRRYINTRRAAERVASSSTVETVEKCRTKSNAVVSSRANTEADAEAEKDIVPAALVAKGDGYRAPNFPLQSVLDAYHDLCPSMPRVRVMTNMRQKHARSRWTDVCVKDKASEEEALEFFRWYFKRAESSDFLAGRKGNKDRVWRADFEWLMTAGNFAKVIEGNYHEVRA